MAIEFTKAGEHHVKTYLGAVLESYRKGQVGRSTATATLFMAMRHAAHDDPKLVQHMQHWLDAVEPRPQPLS